MMLKNAVIRLVVGFTLALVLTISGSIVGDELGWDVTSQVEAGDCGGNGSGSGVAVD